MNKLTNGFWKLHTNKNIDFDDIKIIVFQGLHSTLTGALDEASRKLERLNDMLDEMGFEIWAI